MSNLPSPFISAIAVGPLSLAAIKLEPTIVLRSFNLVVTPVVKLTPYTLEPYIISLPGLDQRMSATITSTGVPVLPAV